MEVWIGLLRIQYRLISDTNLAARINLLRQLKLTATYVDTGSWHHVVLVDQVASQTCLHARRLTVISSFVLCLATISVHVVSRLHVRRIHVSTSIAAHYIKSLCFLGISAV